MDPRPEDDENLALLYGALEPRPLPPRIFIAEDNPEMRALMSSMLQSRGCEVVEAADGLALVNALIRSLTGDPPRAPDLVILEAALPGMSGIDVTRRLRRFDHHTPVILLCASDDTEAMSAAANLGVVCVVEYPFDYADLCATAIAALDLG